VTARVYFTGYRYVTVIERVENTYILNYLQCVTKKTVATIRKDKLPKKILLEGHLLQIEF
jgi:hypothetical protein